MQNLILVVEDDVLTYRLMDNLLTSRGFQVLHAINGSECLEALRDVHPNLILMDMRLPVMDGWETVQHLKADANLRHIPVVAVSVLVTSDDRERALDAGCVAYIAKPFDIKTFSQCVEQYLAYS